MPKRYYILLLMLLALVGCQPKVVREAEAVLAASDSLRVKGIPPTDSALLAETTASLTPWRMLYPTDYAKANYFYGYLLRLRGHHPEAMRCFIEASKSKTRDYLLLGRVYANMANMCQLEGNYELAYTIYEKSKDQFEKAGNSRMYYYAWNNMAIQYAFQKDKDKTYELLSVIARECTDSAVLTKILETKAFACRHNAEYDSTIYYINRLQALGFQEPSRYVLKAQAYWFLQQYDSALVSAQDALSHSCYTLDSISMMYITSHNDSSLNRERVLDITSERADKQFAYTHQQEELAKAVEYLQHELQPDYRWLLGVIITIVIIAVILLIILRATKNLRLKKRQEVQQAKTQLGQIEALFKHVENQLMQDQEKLDQIQRTHYTLHLSNLAIVSKRKEELDMLCTQLRSSQDLKHDLCWEDYGRMCNLANLRFFGIVETLKTQYPELNEYDIKVCILVLIGVSYEQMAEMLLLSGGYMGKRKEIVGKKFGVSMKNLRNFLIDLACGAENMDLEKWQK